MDWQEAKDIEEKLEDIVKYVDFSHIKLSRVYCYRTKGSKTSAYARTWSFPKIFQQALSIEPAYVIEVLSQHFDKLDEDKKKKVLIHELLHIPKNFSGALLPHKSRSRNINTLANQLFKEYKSKQTSQS
jgi:predicted metallopeptidase